METQSVEVTFKFHLPDQDEDAYRTFHAFDMASLLHDIDQLCRSKLKYENPGEELTKFCEELRRMIHEEVNLSRLYR